MTLDKARKVLDSIVERFKAGEIAEAIAAVFYPSPDVPMLKWSIRNRVIAFCAETVDARGFKMWKSAGRSVKKGSKAFYILAPLTYKFENDKGETEYRVRGFKEIPVFRVEDTEGDALEYTEPELPDLPFADVAERFGLTVQANFFDGYSLGWYRPGTETIELHTDEIKVWLHELAHAAHLRAIGEDKFRKNSYSKNEIVAETTALTLALMLGRSWELESGSSHRYLAGYAEDKKEPVDAVFAVVDEVEKTLRLILEPETVETASRAA